MTCKKKFRCASKIVVKHTLPRLSTGWIGLVYESSGSDPELTQGLRKRLDVSELFEVKDIGVFLTTAFQQLVL